MSTITIPIPDDLLARLQQYAKREEKSVEIVASEQLQKALPPRTSPFLEKWAGSIHSGINDWGSNHDAYLGQAIRDEMHRKDTDV